MAIASGGSAGDYVYQDTSLPSSTASMTILWAEKMASDTDAVAASAEIQDSGGNPHTIATQGDGTTEGVYANWGGTYDDAVATLVTGSWVWKAWRGFNDGSDKLRLSIHPDGAGDWTTSDSTITQTAFAPALLLLGDSGRSEPADSLFSHVFIWNGVLTDEQLTTQIASRTPVVTSGLVCFCSLQGVDLTTALTSDTGANFVDAGSWTVSADEPSTFVDVEVSAGEIGITGEIDIAASIDLSSATSVAGSVSASGTYSTVVGGETVTVALLLDGTEIDSNTADFSGGIFSIAGLAASGDGFYQVIATIEDAVSAVSSTLVLEITDGGGTGGEGGGTAPVVTITASKSTIAPDEIATVTITMVDEYGDPVAGATIDDIVVSGALSIYGSEPTVLDGSGEETFQIQGGSEGVGTVVVTVDGTESNTIPIVVQEDLADISPSLTLTRMPYRQLFRG